MLRDWGPGSVRTPRHTSPGGAREAGYTPKCRYRRRSWLAVPRARRARACKARKTHQAWPGEEGGEGGGRSGAASGGGPYDRIFWLFLPGVSLNGLFLSGVSLNGMASVFIGRPPARRRRILFLAVGFPGQAAHTRPANERPPLRDAWPRRARRGRGRGRSQFRVWLRGSRGAPWWW